MHEFFNNGPHLEKNGSSVSVFSVKRNHLRYIRNNISFIPAIPDDMGKMKR